MAFQSRQVGPYQYQISDSERQIDLVRRYGLSDGSRVFKLIGQFDSCEFHASYTLSWNVTNEQKAQGIEGGYIWEIRGAPDREFAMGADAEGICLLRDLIAEALEVYGVDGDRGTGVYVLVKFWQGFLDREQVRPSKF